MKRITLSIITGVCLMIAGQASAHSGHHSHSNRGANERVTIITQPARPIIDVAISVPEIGLYVNVLPGAHRVEPTFRIKFRNKSLGIMCQVHQ